MTVDAAFTPDFRPEPMGCGRNTLNVGYSVHNERMMQKAARFRQYNGFARGRLLLDSAIKWLAPIGLFADE